MLALIKKDTGWKQKIVFIVLLVISLFLCIFLYQCGRELGILLREVTCFYHF